MVPPTPTFRQLWGLLLEDKPLLFPAECQLGHTATLQWKGSCMPEWCDIAFGCWENEGKLRVTLCQDSLALTGFCWLLSLICFYFPYLPFQCQSSFYLSLLSFCQPTLAASPGPPVSSLSLWLLCHWEGAEGQTTSSKILSSYHLTSVFSAYSLPDSAPVPQAKTPSLPVFPAPGSLLHTCISCWQRITVHALGCENTGHSHPHHAAGIWRAVEANILNSECFGKLLCYHEGRCSSACCICALGCTAGRQLVLPQGAFSSPGICLPAWALAEKTRGFRRGFPLA